MSKFEKGHHIGRPKGAKDKKWFKVTTWIYEIEKVWPELTANQKAHYSLELTKALLSKLKQLPTDSNESVLNATEAIEVLKQFDKSIKSEDVK